MKSFSHLAHFGNAAVAAIAQHFGDGAWFVLIGQGPGIHSIVDRSGELWFSETPIIGVMLRYIGVDEAREVYLEHSKAYGDVQRAAILIHAFYPDRTQPSIN